VLESFVAKYLAGGDAIGCGVVEIVGSQPKWQQKVVVVDQL
jgi:hypothetical protein